MNKLEESESIAFVDFFKVAQGLLGYELEQYRILRTERIKGMYNSLCQFHLGGAARITEVWNPTGAKVVEATYVDEDDFDASFVPVRRLSARLSVAKPIFTGDKTVSLKVVKSYVSKKSKFLSLEEGEILTGHRHNEDLWEAINKSGKRGYVYPEYVVVGNAPNNLDLKPAPGKTKKVSVPPGLIMAPPGLSDDEFSEDGDDDLSTFTNQSSNNNQRRVSKKVLISRSGAPGPPPPNLQTGIKPLAEQQDEQTRTILIKNLKKVVTKGDDSNSGRVNAPRKASKSVLPAGRPPAINPLLAALNANPKAGLKKVDNEQVQTEKSRKPSNIGGENTLMGELQSALHKRNSVTKPE